MSTPTPRIPARGRYRLVRIPSPSAPPVSDQGISVPEGPCRIVTGRRPPSVSGRSCEAEARGFAGPVREDPWAAYQAARATGTLQPPSVSQLTEQDVRRARHHYEQAQRSREPGELKVLPW